jgi:hypothetical protein
MKSYSFADLFAGCGGLSLGLSYAGLRGKFAIERDPMAFETFSANFIENQLSGVAFDWPTWLAKQAWDIELLLAQHKDDLVKLQGTIDVLAGGPPCQGFSFAGRRVEDDPRNLLFEKYVEVVGALQPQALIVENVPGMRIAHARRNVVDLPIPSEQGAKPKSFYDKLVDSLDMAGYKMEAMLVDSSRFGVPQERGQPLVVPTIQTPAINREEQVRLAEIESARLSQLFVGSNTAVTTQSLPSLPQLTMPDLIAPVANAPLPLDAGAAQNMQDRKLDFLTGEVDTRAVSAETLMLPASRYLVQAGSIIPAALITGIRSDLPGQITAQVTSPVYDTPTGRYLLIPQGARLIGRYDMPDRVRPIPRAAGMGPADPAEWALDPARQPAGHRHERVCRA